MKIEIPSYDLLSKSAFASRFTTCGLDTIAQMLDEVYSDTPAKDYVIDDTLLNSWETTPKEACEEYECKDLDELKEKISGKVALIEYMTNGNVLIVE